MPTPTSTPEQTAHQELLLDKPRLQLPRSNIAFEIFFYTTLVLLGGFGSLCCVHTAFGFTLYPTPLILIGVVYAVLGVLQSLLPRGRVVVFAAGALAWGIALLYFSEPAAEGIGRVLNLILRIYSEKLQFPLRQFAVPEAEPEVAAYTSTAFAAMLIPPFFWLLSWILVRRRNAAAAFSFTGVVLSLAMALSIIPEFWAICLLLLFWCMLLLSATVLGRRHRVLDEQRRIIVSGAAIRPALLILLLAAVLCMLLVYVLFPRDTYSRPRLVNDVRAGFVDGFGLDAMIQGGQGSNNNRVSLDNLGARTYSGKTAMRVRYDWVGDNVELGENQQKDYLKCFVGSVYTGRSWEKMAEGDTSALEDFAAPGQVQNMGSGFIENFPVPYFEGEPLRYALSLETVGVNPRCIFSPYGLIAGEDISGLDMEYESDAFLHSSNLFSGTRQYQFNAMSLPGVPLTYGIRFLQNWEDNLVTNPSEAYQEAFFADEARRAAVENHENKLYAAIPELAGGEDASDLLYDGLHYKAPEWAKTPLSAGQQALVAMVEPYNDFVPAHYLQVPEELESFLAGFRSEHGLDIPLDMGEGNYGFFLEQLQAFLEEEYSYTLTPEPPPEGTDFTEFFLSQSKSGYCVHFATAAVLLCRSAGIPARYAEGYAVPSGYNGMWVDVPDKNAHAWLEVYYSGSGWVPVEVTPASADAPAAYYNAQAPAGGTEGEGEGDAPEAEATPSPTPTPTPQPTVSPQASMAPLESQGPEEKRQEDGRPVWGLFLIFGGVLLLVPVGLVGNRFIRKYLRRKAFSQEDRSKAGLALYGHLLKMQALEATLYYGERKPPARWEEIALKARFGREMLDEEELQVLAADAADLEKSLKEELPRDRKLYWEYVRGLF